MSVLVIGLNGIPLMPTTERKARILLKDNKAFVVSRHPFAIRLLYKTGCAVQVGQLGVDTGSQNIGIGVVCGNRVILKEEHQLRASMEKRSLIESCASFRRNRRYRKTRYRHPKWKHHTKRVFSEQPDKKGRHWHKADASYQSSRKEGWLPPSLQSKCDHHIRIINRYIRFLPKCISDNLIIEAGRFDMARMQDPTVRGELYQKGPMYEAENLKAYIFTRDNYTCQCCGAKAGTARKDGTVVKLIAHHVLFRSRGATDNPKYMASVCTACHTAKAHEPGGILYEWMVKQKKFTRGLRDAAFMNILRKRLFAAFPDAIFTYGNITSADRKCLRMEKTHVNDAVAVACYGKEISRLRDNSRKVTCYKQVRRTKRSLHEAAPRKGRKTPNRIAARNNKNVVSVKGFRLWDTVLADGRKLYLTGFSGSSAYLVDKDGQYISPPGKTYKQWTLSKLTRLHPNGGWLMR